MLIVPGGEDGLGEVVVVGVSQAEGEEFGREALD